jgi:hypothetical protein
LGQNIYPLLHFPRGLKDEFVARGNMDRLARSRIMRHASFLLFDFEPAETPDLDVVTFAMARLRYVP